MRYRVEKPTLWVDSDEVRVNFIIPDSIYGLLETEHGSPNLKADSRKKVLEAIRLVANETRGGHVLCATGQKVYGPIPSEIFYKAERHKINGIPYVQLFILKSALISAANGDPDDLAAISAATTGDMVTVELDWGDEPPEYLEGEDDSKALAQFFGVTLLEGYEFMQDTEVCDELEDIMRVIDPNLTAEQAAAITAQTLNPSES
jgi:hypothetical protein